MYTAILDDGQRVTGDQCHWHDLPAHVKIVSLGAQISDGLGRVIADDVYAGFDAYGFQMYDVDAVGGGPLARGVQLICVTDGHFLSVDINVGNGQRRCLWRPVSQLTYARSLLRQGLVRP